MAESSFLVFRTEAEAAPSLKAKRRLTSATLDQLLELDVIKEPQEFSVPNDDGVVTGKLTKGEWQYLTKPQDHAKAGLALAQRHGFRDTGGVIAFFNDGDGEFVGYAAKALAPDAKFDVETDPWVLTEALCSGVPLMTVLRVLPRGQQPRFLPLNEREAARSLISSAGIIDVMADYQVTDGTGVLSLREEQGGMRGYEMRKKYKLGFRKTRSKRVRLPKGFLQVPITGGKQVAEIVRGFAKGRVGETSYVLHLDADNLLIGVEEISRGDMTSTPFAANMALRGAVCAPHTGGEKTARIILSHHHPGISAEPSPEDIQLTAQLGLIANALRVKIADHVVVSDTGQASIKAMAEGGRVPGRVGSVLSVMFALGASAFVVWWLLRPEGVAQRNA